MRISRFARTVLLAVILSFSLAGSALAKQAVTPTVTLPITGLKVTESYASGLYYKKLLKAMEDSAGLSPVDRFVAIAMSQNGYTGSTKSSNLSGTVGSGTAGNYNEYNNDMKQSGEAWCAAFVSWCAKAAGLSTSVMPRGTLAGTWQTTPGNGTLYWLWSPDFTAYDTSVTIQKGDLVLFNPSDYDGRDKDFTAYDKNGNKDKYNTKGDNCEGHYMSRSGTAHVAIVAEAKKNSDGSYTIKTIERRGKKVGQQTIKTNDGSFAYGYTACSHVYGERQTIPKLKAVYRPNWSAASVWPASQFDNEAPVIGSVATKNITSTGFDVVVKAADNNAVSKIRLNIWSGGVRRYDQTLDVTNAANYSGTFHLNWSDLGNLSNALYRVHVYAYDEYGNASVSKSVDIYSDTEAPGDISLDVTNLTNTGYDLTIHAEDENSIEKVKIAIWSMAQERYNQTHTVNGGTSFSKTYHFNFADLGNVANTTYRNNVNVTDSMGNTSSRIYTDVFADMTPPTILSASMEQADEQSLYVHVYATDAIDLAKIVVRVAENGAVCAEASSSVVGVKEAERSLLLSIPYDEEEPLAVHRYKAMVTVYDSAGNFASYEIPDELVFNDPNVMPDEYYGEEGVWTFEISGGKAYLTGLSDTALTIETLGAGQWPTSVAEDGRVYPVAGTTQAEAGQASFGDLPNLRKITGFPASYETIGGFADCANLTSVAVNAERIDANAFAGCAALAYVELGAETDVIGADAFSGCGSLKEIRYAGTQEMWAAVDVNAQSGDVLASGVRYKYELTSGSTVEACTSSGCVIKTVFRNEGYAEGYAQHWEDVTFELYDAGGNALGSCEKTLSAAGEEAICFIRTSEDLGIALQAGTVYQYRVGVVCNGMTYRSDMRTFSTEAADHDTVYVSDVMLNYTGMTLTAGDTLQLYRTAMPGNATNQNVVWTSSNTAVATVSTSGKVTAVSAGTAIITCTAAGAKTAGSVKETCAIGVVSAGSCSCSTSSGNWYRVKNTSGSLTISSIHGASTSSGAAKLGSIPEGAVVYVQKATGYSGLGSSSGEYGHVSYNGVNGFCSMNYLEAIGSMTVNLDLNGGYKPEGFSTDYLYMRVGTPINYAISNRIPARTGYRFEGWTTAKDSGSTVFDMYGRPVIDGKYWANDSVYGTVWAGASVKTLYAAWSPEEYTITFDPCGGSAKKLTAAVVYGTATGNAQTALPTKAGYTFLGWYTEPEGGVQVYNAIGQCVHSGTYFNTTVWNYPSDLTVYAHWEPSDQTAPVISDVTVHGVDGTGFCVSCNVRDRIDRVVVKVWTGMDSEEAEEEFVEENVFEAEADVVDDRATVRIDVPETGESYSILITATDTAGSSTSYLLSEDDRIYVDGNAPKILDAEIANLTAEGFSVACGVTDDTRVERVQMLVWPDSKEMPDDQSWTTDEAHSAKLKDGRWIYTVDAASCGLLPGAYQVAVRAWDVYGKESETSFLTLTLPGAAESEALVYGSHDGHVYVLYSAGSNADWSAASSACKALGGHLATIESAAENAAVAAMMSRYAAYDGKAWIDGGSEAYSNWNGGRPANAKYAVMNPDGTWSGEESGRAHSFVCEYDEGILKLPQLREIHSEAFMGTDARILVIPVSCERIEARAFAGCEALAFILMPEGAAITMADDAFEQTDAMVIAY